LWHPNAVINDFNRIGSRTDTGALWENFVIAERMKYLRNNNIDSYMYFWRTTQQQEIDLIEERDGQLKAFECKWGKTRKSKTSLDLYRQLSGTETNVINPDNLEEFYKLRASNNAIA
jgi:predicted AAA+ superfamily ATPase